MAESSIFEQIEAKAFDLRKTMGDVCAVSGVAHSTWSRAKKRGYIRARTVARLESGLAFLARQGEQQPPSAAPEAVA